MRYLGLNAAKILALGIVGALTIWAGVILVLHGAYGMAVLLVVGAGGINYIYFSPAPIPCATSFPG